MVFRAPPISHPVRRDRKRTYMPAKDDPDFAEDAVDETDSNPLKTVVSHALKQKG